MLQDLAQALFDLHQQKSVRAVILTGAGATFCAGADLREMHEVSRQQDAQQQWHDDAEQFREVLEVMLRFPKPMIAAVDGPAVAGGAALALACDIVVASRKASFGFPEVRRGLAPGLAAPLLVFRAGAGAAAKLLLTGETVDADEARRIGVFHEVVESEQIWARAQQIAVQCAQSPGEAIQLTKRQLNEMIGDPLSTHLVTGAATSATSRTTEAAAEGLAAFIEKRPPKWP
jgi:methylglutaconyl-CoA hydratase